MLSFDRSASKTTASSNFKHAENEDQDLTQEKAEHYKAKNHIVEKAPQEQSVEMADDHIDLDVLRDEHDDYDDTENDSNDDYDGGDDEDWFTCVGQFQYMSKQLSQSNAILQEIEKVSCSDQDGSLWKIVSATSKVKEAAKKF